METPYFVQLLANSRLVREAVRASSIHEIDLQDTICIQSGPGHLKLIDFRLSDDECFKLVDISVTRYATLLDFISADLKYFEQSGYYFNVYNSGRKTFVPYRVGSSTYNARSKRIANIQLWGRTLQGTILSSDLFGCKIMLSFNR
jgi:hypothetical protein